MGKGKGKKARAAGFNTPFAQLATAKKPAAEPPRAAPPPPPPPPAAGVDDRQLFLEAVRGSDRLSRSGKRVEPEKREKAEVPNDDALVVAELEALVAGDAPFRIEDTGEVVYGLAPGVQPRLLDALKRGEVAWRRHLDLHGHTRDAAHLALNAFVGEARRDGERCVLVVTGRGKGSPGGVAVLRESLPRWLSRAPLAKEVLGFCTARGVDGGPGAFYVLLRK